MEDLTKAIADVEAAILEKEKEQAMGNLDKASVANPVDVTSLFLTNPGYDSNKNDGWQGSTPGFQSYTNAEFYQSVFDTYQKVTGVPEGVFKLSVQAFYRPGGAQDGYNRFINNDAQIKDVKMYATQGDLTYSQAITTPYPEAGATAIGTGGRVFCHCSGRQHHLYS